MQISEATIHQNHSDKTQLPEAISDNPFFFNRNLRIETNDGRATLRGTVNSFFHKQMAQEIVRGLEGVEEIENELVVDWK